MGRPRKPITESKFAGKQDEILGRISDGETLSEICRRDGMPDRNLIYQWCEKDQNFAARFAQARARGFDAIADDCKRIADDGSADYVMTDDGPALDKEHIQRSKLRVETRLKLLAKWDPKRYGDKLQQEITVSDGRAERLARARERAGK